MTPRLLTWRRSRFSVAIGRKPGQVREEAAVAVDSGTGVKPVRAAAISFFPAMSYQALARKWRPKQFAEVVGQQHAVVALSNALTQQRVHHAFLFTGTRGVGKTTLARILARALNCRAGMSATPCGECAHCQALDGGQAMDYLEIDAASRTRIEDTLELLQGVPLKPIAERFKIYLIDEVHMLSTSSFNALLKTLEEPPEHVKFLFATTSPEKLPITVLSRCLQLNLHALSVEQISGHLRHILEREKIEFDEAATELIARSAAGSVRDSLSLLDQAINFGGGQVQVDSVRSMLGLAEPAYGAALLGAIAAGDAAGALEAVGQIEQGGGDCALALDELIHLLHNLCLFKASPEALAAKGIRAEGLADLAGAVETDQLHLLYQLGLASRRDFDLALDARSGLEMAVLRMAAFATGGAGESGGSGGSVESVGSAGSVRSAGSGRSAGSAGSVGSAGSNGSAEKSPKPRTAKPAPIDLEQPEAWAEFISHYPEQGINLELLRQLCPRPGGGKALILQLDRKHSALHSEERARHIIEWVTAQLPEPRPVKIEMLDDDTAELSTPARLRDNETAARQSDAEKRFREDAGVQQFLGQFDGSIVPDSIDPAPEEPDPTPDA